MAEGRVERSSHDMRAHRCGALDDPFDMLQGGGPLLRRIADRVHLDVWNNSNSSRLQPELLQPAPDLRVMGGLALEDGDLDAVITSAFQVLQQGPMLRLDMRGPQQHIKADFHLVPPQESPSRRRALAPHESLRAACAEARQIPGRSMRN